MLLIFLITIVDIGNEFTFQDVLSNIAGNVISNREIEEKQIKIYNRTNQQRLLKVDEKNLEKYRKALEFNN